MLVQEKHIQSEIHITYLFWVTSPDMYLDSFNGSTLVIMVLVVQ